MKLTKELTLIFFILSFILFGFVLIKAAYNDAPILVYNFSNSSVIIGQDIIIITNWSDENLTDYNLTCTLFVNGIVNRTINSSGSYCNFSYQTNLLDYPNITFIVSASDVYENSTNSSSMITLVNLSCGNVISKNITLVREINCINSSLGLNITENNIMIDCNGYPIIGNGTTNGIILGGENITIKNCKFNNSALLSLGNRNLLTFNEFYNSNYGLIIEGNNNNVSFNSLYNHTIGIIINSNNTFLGDNNITSCRNLAINDSGSNTHWFITNRNKITNNNLTIKGNISFDDSGVLELIDSYLTLNNVKLSNTGNITSLELKKINISANNETNIEFSKIGTDMVIYLIENVSAIIFVSSELPASTPNSSFIAMKGIDVEVDNNTSGNLSWTYIKIYYTDSELTSKGINESTIKIYYYNSSSNSWQLEQNQGVNIESNFVWVNVTHFSFFGVFGVNTTISRGESSNKDSNSQSGQNEENVISGVYWITTYNVNESVLLAGYTKELFVQERVKFDIGGEIHYVGVVGLNATTVVINVSSEPQQAALNIGEEKQFNIDNSSENDLKVKLNNIRGITANLTITLIKQTSEQILENKTKQDNNITSEEEKEIKTKKWNLVFVFISSFLIIIFIIFLLLYFFKKRSQENLRDFSIRGVEILPKNNET